MKNQVMLCVSVAVLSLVTAAAFHRFLPGFGPAFKPLLWPLVLLVFAKRTRYAAVTAFLVPYASCLVNGMPSFSVAVGLSAVSACVVILAHHCLRRFSRLGVMRKFFA